MMDWAYIQEQQKLMCDKLNVAWTPVDQNSLIAFNDSLLSPLQPINGFRHLKERSIDGWYLWSGGEIPQDDDTFFKPLHANHLIQYRPLVLKYLGLPPGWRFQIDDQGYEDIWFDESLLRQ